VKSDGSVVSDNICNHLISYVKLRQFHKSERERHENAYNSRITYF